jgi:hypothetical protein
VNDNVWAAMLSFFAFPLLVLVLAFVFRSHKRRK